MNAILKSVLLAFVGMGTFFFFLMMAVVPTMAVLARTSGRIEQHSVVVGPEQFMHTWGLPAAAVVFVICFFIAMRYSTRAQRNSATSSHA